MNQLVPFIGNSNNISSGSGLLFVPATCALMSSVLLPLQTVLSSSTINRLFAELSGRDAGQCWERMDISEFTEDHPNIPNPKPCSQIPSHRDCLIFGCTLIRLISCAALFVLSAIAALLRGDGLMDAKEISSSLFYAYLTSLATFVFFRPHAPATASHHLAILLLVMLGVYAWHVILPLAICKSGPVGSAGDWLSWTRFGILMPNAIAAPLCTPRQYGSVDPGSQALSKTFP